MGGVEGNQPGGVRCLAGSCGSRCHSQATRGEEQILEEAQSCLTGAVALGGGRQPLPTTALTSPHAFPASAIASYWLNPTRSQSKEPDQYSSPRSASRAQERVESASGGSNTVKSCQTRVFFCLVSHLCVPNKESYQRNKLLEVVLELLHMHSPPRSNHFT